MSVYAGFTTRQQETAYSNHTETLMTLMANKILYAMQGEPLDEQYWAQKFIQTYNRMNTLERNKHHPPKLSETATKLAQLLNGQYTFSRISSASSSFYDDPQPQPPIRTPRLTPRRTPRRTPFRSFAETSLDRIREVPSKRITRKPPARRYNSNNSRSTSYRKIAVRRQEKPPPSYRKIAVKRQEKPPPSSIYYERLMQRYLNMSTKYNTSRGSTLRNDSLSSEMWISG